MKKILPIAIDLGAKNTGVFSAFYNKNTNLDDISLKQGKVYELSKDSYTWLMTSRTNTRHQKRGLDRKQLVKRLFKLVWEEQLKLPWDDYTQQTISFLLNRRGFSFLEEKHDTDILSKVPANVVELLPEIMQPSADEKIIDSDSVYYDINSKIRELLENDGFDSAYSIVNSDIKNVKDNLVLCKFLTLITKSCDEKYISELVIPNKTNKFDSLKKVSAWIVDLFVKDGLKLDIESVSKDRYSYDILEYINHLSIDELTLFKQSIPTNNEDDFKSSIWNCNQTKMSLDSEQIIKKLENNDIKAHIQHICFAMFNMHKELQSGSRYRAKYFEEVATSR